MWKGVEGITTLFGVAEEMSKEVVHQIHCNVNKLNCVRK